MQPDQSSRAVHRHDCRLSRASSTCASGHLHCLIFFPGPVRVLPLASTVMVTPPPWNGLPVSVALSWARLPSVRSVPVRPSFSKSTETMPLPWQRYVLLFSFAVGSFVGAIVSAPWFVFFLFVRQED